MKKTIGIILIVIASLNMVTWLPDAVKGNSEGALYYIAIIGMLIIGINLVLNSRTKLNTEIPTVKKNKADLSANNKPRLSQKYHLLLEVIMDSHPRNKIWQDIDNKLVVGVRSTGGETLFHIKETIDGMVNISYEIKNNPSFLDFSLNYEFGQEFCLKNPMKVLELINLKIKKHLLNGKAKTRG